MRISRAIFSMILLIVCNSQLLAQEQILKELPESQIATRDQLSLGKIFLPQTPVEWAVNVGSAMIVSTFLLVDQEITVMPWQKDRWNSTNGAYISKYDKVEHFGGAAFFHSHLIGLNHAGVVRSTAFRRIKLSLMLITWWEIKDSVVSSERYGTWGGEGFSMKDWAASASGVFATELLNFALKEITK